MHPSHQHEGVRAYVNYFYVGSFALINDRGASIGPVVEVSLKMGLLNGLRRHEVLTSYLWR